MRKLKQPLLSAALAALAGLAPAPTFASGYDTGEQDWDFLFQEKTISFEAGVRYIAPRRTLNNIIGVFGPSIDATEAEAFAIPRFSVTARLGETAACMASYREPWGGHANYGVFWTYAASAVEQHFSSQDYGLTCRAQAQLSKGQLHFIGGVSYQTIKYELTRAIGFGAVASTAVGDSGIGWRAGAAYEIPEYALRVSLIYNSEIDYRMTGTLTAAPVVIPIFGNIKMPQSIELKARSGIAPGWLAFGAVKWTDWSVADNMWLCPTGVPACGAPAAVSALTLQWKDTFTVTLGVAHQFNDVVSVATSVTWDQGATQGFTSQTDTWVADATVVIIPSDKVEISLGANIGLMTGGALSTMVLPGGIPNPVGYTATFGNDVLYGFSANAKLRF